MVRRLMVSTGAYWSADTLHACPPNEVFGHWYVFLVLYNEPVSVSVHPLVQMTSGLPSIHRIACRATD